MGRVDLDRLASLRLAGDAYMWHAFAEEADLWIVEAWLGTFSGHGGHLSADKAAYWKEAATFAAPIPWLDAATGQLDRAAWRLPNRVKKAFNPHLLRYQFEARRWA
jgi:hypothetical protein